MSNTPLVLEATRVCYWNPAYELTFFQSPSFPSSIPDAHIHCAFVFAFDPDRRLLMGNHALRGYDLPGGKREPGERVEDAACREAKEEVGLTLSPSNLLFFGYELVHDPAPIPHNPKYPFPNTYFAHYLVINVDSSKVYNPRNSTEKEVEQMTDTKWFTEVELRTHKWFVQRPKVLNAMLQVLSTQISWLNLQFLVFSRFPFTFCSSTVPVSPLLPSLLNSFPSSSPLLPLVL